MRQRFVCQWLSCTFCFTVHLDHGNAGGGACDLSPPVPAVCRPVLPPLPAPGQRPVGPAYIRRRLVAGLCPLTGSSGSSFPIEGRENRQSIVPQCFAGFTGSLQLDYGFAASTLCSITGTAHSLCTRSRLIFSATPTPESRMGADFPGVLRTCRNAPHTGDTNTLASCSPCAAPRSYGWLSQERSCRTFSNSRKKQSAALENT